jgi:hypothetical protein
LIVQQDRITRRAEIAYIVLIMAAAAMVWREASLLPPAPYDVLGPKSFPIWVSYGLAALAMAMLARVALGKALGRAAQSMVTGLGGAAAHAPRPWVAALTLLLAFAYAAALSVRAIPFLPATALYLFLACAVLGPITRKRLTAAALFAVAAAIGLDLLFRSLFQLDLT